MAKQSANSVGKFTFSVTPSKVSGQSSKRVEAITEWLLSQWHSREIKKAS